MNKTKLSAVATMIRTLFGVTSCIALMSVWLTVSAAEQSTPNNEATSAVETNEAGDQTEASSETAENGQNAVAPKDTLGGAGLRDKKLSVVFEQFVPSETISADNAVPFPTDI